MWTYISGIKCLNFSENRIITRFAGFLSSHTIENQVCELFPEISDFGHLKGIDKKAIFRSFYRKHFRWSCCYVPKEPGFLHKYNDDVLVILSKGFMQGFMQTRYLMRRYERNMILFQRYFFTWFVGLISESYYKNDFNSAVFNNLRTLLK